MGNDLQRYLGLPSVLMGSGLPDGNIWAPNERMNVENISRGADALVEYLW